MAIGLWRIVTYGSICELAQGCVIDLADFIASPVGTGGSSSGRLDEDIGNAAGERCGARGTLDSCSRNAERSGARTAPRLETLRATVKDWMAGKRIRGEKRGYTGVDKSKRGRFTGWTVTTIMWGKQGEPRTEYYHWSLRATLTATHHSHRWIYWVYGNTHYQGCRTPGDVGKRLSLAPLAPTREPTNAAFSCLVHVFPLGESFLMP